MNTPNEKEENTLKYSEQLTEMVKINHHQLQLEKQLMEAKKHFQKKSKSELIDLILSLTDKLDKSKKKYYKNNTKPDLIAILVKNWMLNKKELDKKIDEEIAAIPVEVKKEIEKIAVSLNDINFYNSKIDLPDTPEWDGTEWEIELDNAINNGYEYIITPDGSKFKINNRNSVINI